MRGLASGICRRATAPVPFGFRESVDARVNPGMEVRSDFAYVQTMPMGVTSVRGAGWREPL